MALTRRYLKELGLEGEVIDKIMDSYGSTMSDMMTKTEAEDNLKKALENAKKEFEASQPKPVVVKDSDEYKELAKKYSDLELDVKLTGAKVKDKYRDFVKSKLTGEKPFEESIKSVMEEYGEFFDIEKKEEPKGADNKPVFTETQKKTGEPTEQDKVKEAFLKAFK